MKLENLEVKVTVAIDSDLKTNYEFKLDSYELTPEEHEQECKILLAMLPHLGKLITDMTNKKK